MSNPQASSKKAVKGGNKPKAVVPKDEPQVENLVANGNDKTTEDPEFMTLDDFLNGKIKEAVAITIGLKETMPGDLAKMSEEQREHFFSKKITTLFNVTTDHIHKFSNEVANEGIEIFEKERQFDNKEEYSYSELYTLQYVARNKAHTLAKAHIGAKLSGTLIESGPSVEIAGATYNVVRFNALVRLEDHFDALCKKEDDEHKRQIDLDPHGILFEETEEQILEKKEKEMKGDQKRVSYMLTVWNSLKVENEQLFREVKAARMKKESMEASRRHIEEHLFQLRVREHAEMQNARNREINSRRTNQMISPGQIIHQIVYPPLPTPDNFLYPMTGMARCVCEQGCRVELQEPAYHILTPDDLEYWGINTNRTYFRPDPPVPQPEEQ